MFSRTQSLFKSVFGVGLLSGAALLAATTASAQYNDPPARVARLAHIDGQVSIQPSGVDQWSAASSNYPVATGDRVYADQDGRGEISAGSAVARVWHSTDVTMTNLTDQLMQLGLAQGTVRVHSYQVDQYNQVEIDTPNGAVIVTRPGDIRIDVYGPQRDQNQDGNQDSGQSIVTVNSGAVQLSGPNLQQDVYAGQSVQLWGSNPIQVSENQMPNGDDFDSWSLSRERHGRNSETARYVNRDTVGSDDLDDYGSWSQSSDYGPVWYPRQVSADWAPYREGHWVWTGPWGWTWVEDEPWGYAPFHYGRWVQVDDRWGWMPGPVEARPIWSPALVAFVGGGGFGGDDYGRSRGGIGISIGGISAWFPLGPGEAYHPWYHCSDSYQQRVNVTNVNITVIHNTTVINNYNNYLRNPQDTSRINNVQYANRAVAVTAMRQADFAGARSAQANMVHINQQQLAQAQIVAHPTIRPTVQSVAPRPVSVPVPVQRPTLLTQGGRQMVAAPGARSQPVPYRPLPTNGNVGVNGGRNPGLTPGGSVGIPNRGGNVATPARPLPPTAPGSPQQPSYARPTVPVTASGRSDQLQNYPQRSPVTQPGNPQQTYPQRPTIAQPTNPNQSQNYPQRPLVNRNEVPAPRPSFQQQQPAFKQDPGRPLSPQQMQNLNQGRPAGPSRDAEYPPHQQGQPGYQAPARPAPQQPPVPQYRPTPQPAPQQQQPALQYRPAPQPQFRPDPQMQNRPSPEPQNRPAPQQQQYRPAPQPQSRPEPAARPVPDSRPAPKDAKDKDKQPNSGR